MAEITLQATLENIVTVTAMVDEQLEALDCPMKEQMQLDIAIDELFSNIARYAYDGGPGNASVLTDYQDGVFSITFVDEGKPYNPLGKEDPDVTLSAEERTVGGLGIFMVKKTMDDMVYRFEE